LEIIVFALISYLIGSIPFGRTLGLAVAKIDVRDGGSGNIGATNVARQIGIKWGLLTLALDGFKGAAPVLAAGAFYGEVTGIQEVAGLAAILGHQFSIFLNFRGGKGVATALGMFCALEPAVCGIIAVVFLITVAASNYVSLGSIIAAMTLPVVLAINGSGVERIGVGVAAALLIVLRHKDNIGRLIKGNESRLRRKKAN
jgi:glycerol-3-phosphate acyltransferase PlsY